MERHKGMMPKVYALETLHNATPAQDREKNSEIVGEAMKLYQLCKRKYMHWDGKAAGAAVGIGVGIAGAAVTSGLSIVAACWLYGGSLAKSEAWQLLKNKCKEIGEAAVQNSDMEFTKTSEGTMTFLSPFMTLGGVEIFCFC